MTSWSAGFSTEHELCDICSDETRNPALLCVVENPADRQEANALGGSALDDNKTGASCVEKPADPPAIPGKPDLPLPSWQRVNG